MKYVLLRHSFCIQNLKRKCTNLRGDEGPIKKVLKKKEILLNKDGCRLIIWERRI